MHQVNHSEESAPQSKFGSNLKNGKYIQVDGTQIYYETYGKGSPLLLLHGGLGSISNFDKCIPTLAEHFEVIAPDSPGHGRSSHLEFLSYPLLAQYLSQFITKLKLDGLYIIGWSDGATLGLLLSEMLPDKVKKLIAVGLPTRFDALTPEGMQWVNHEMIEEIKKDRAWMDHYLSLTIQPEKVFSFIENTQRMWQTKTYISEERLTSIKTPTLILQGDKDALTLEHAIEVYRKICNSQLCILPDTSHFVLEEKPDLLNQIAIDFIKKG